VLCVVCCVLCCVFLCCFVLFCVCMCVCDAPTPCDEMVSCVNPASDHHHLAVCEDVRCQSAHVPDPEGEDGNSHPRGAECFSIFKL